jgi:hypothetical protein
MDKTPLIQLPSFASWTNRLKLRHLAMLLNISKHPNLTAAAESGHYWLEHPSCFPQL